MNKRSSFNYQNLKSHKYLNDPPKMVHRSTKWQHCKGNGVIDFDGEERKAEVHWFQEETVGKVKFKVKRWIDED